MRFNPHLKSKPLVPPPAKPGSITQRAADVHVGSSQPADGKSAALSTGFPITVTKNERNGVEIRFPTKPDDATRERLKRAGFRWHGGRGCWYHRMTPENWTFATDFVASSKLNVESSPPATCNPQPAPTVSTAIIKVDFGGRVPTTPPLPNPPPRPGISPLMARMLRKPQ